MCSVVASGAATLSQQEKNNSAAVQQNRGNIPALLAPHTSGLRDVPRCGALSLLQKTLHYRGNPSETAAERKIVDFGGGGRELPQGC